MEFIDAVTISGTRIRDDGYMVADARVARIGVQEYTGAELGRPDMVAVRVLRPEGEVFSADSLASFAHRPITEDHRGTVTADNWKSLAVGQTDGQVVRDGDFVRVPLMIADRSAIEKIQAGKRELSAGYSCDLQWEGGLTEDGIAYDAVQTNIRINHIAIVDRARAGRSCRVGDNDKEQKMANRTVMVDGLSVETTDAGAQAIEKLIADRKAATDAQATLQAQLDDARSKILTADAIAKMVEDRVGLELVAKTVAPSVSPRGLTNDALRLAAVKAALGDRLPAARESDTAYINARFDILAEDASSKDTFRAGRVGGAAPAVTDAMAVRQKAFDDLMYFDQHGVERPAN